jgi:hypothetical protein
VRACARACSCVRVRVIKYSCVQTIYLIHFSDYIFLYISFICTFSLLETISTFMWVIEGDIRE